jgi:hypothetical protein
MKRSSCKAFVAPKNLPTKSVLSHFLVCRDSCPGDHLIGPTAHLLFRESFCPGALGKVLPMKTSHKILFEGRSTKNNLPLHFCGVRFLLSELIFTLQGITLRRRHIFELILVIPTPLGIMNEVDSPHNTLFKELHNKPHLSGIFRLCE